MARSRRLRLICLSIANLLLPLAVVTFASGFFPFKPLLPGLATFSDTHPLDDSSSARPPAIFNRVIFMVVDALRSDFVYGHNSGFTFTQRHVPPFRHAQLALTHTTVSSVPARRSLSQPTPARLQ